MVFVVVGGGASGAGAKTSAPASPSAPPAVDADRLRAGFSPTAGGGAAIDGRTGEPSSVGVDRADDKADDDRAGSLSLIDSPLELELAGVGAPGVGGAGASVLRMVVRAAGGDARGAGDEVGPEALSESRDGWRAGAGCACPTLALAVGVLGLLVPSASDSGAGDDSVSDSSSASRRLAWACRLFERS